MKNPKPEISNIIEIAFMKNDDEMIKDLYRINEYVNDDFSLNYIDEPEILEMCARILTRIDIELKLFGGVFTICNCPIEKQMYVSWLFTLFAFLESETQNWTIDSHDRIYSPNEEHYKVFSNESMPKDIDITGLNFLYEKVIVQFKN
jgi:hypothetical protein